MIKFILDNSIELFALSISFISLALSLHSKFKERIKIKIDYNPEDSLCFGFIYYDIYKILFAKIDIVNLSNTPVSISKIYLKDSTGNTFISTSYDIGDSFNKNGITLYNKDDPSHGNLHNLKSENILNNLRLDSYGNLSGYAVFFNVEPIQTPTSFTIFIEVSNKTFSKNITISPLPDNLKPLHELTN